MKRVSDEIIECGSISRESFGSLISCKTIKEVVLRDLEIYQDELVNSIDTKSGGISLKSSTQMAQDPGFIG